jgi:hypothetical protein
LLSQGWRQQRIASPLRCRLSRGRTLWSVDVDADCAAAFSGHSLWRFVYADSRGTATLRAAGVPSRSTCSSSFRVWLFSKRAGRRLQRELRGQSHRARVDEPVGAGSLADV